MERSKFLTFDKMQFDFQIGFGYLRTERMKSNFESGCSVYLISDFHVLLFGFLARSFTLLYGVLGIDRHFAKLWYSRTARSY